MNILFIFTCGSYLTVSKPLQYQGSLHFGISYISSILKHNGHKTELLVLTRETKNKFIEEYIQKFNPSLICFTAVCNEYKFIAETAKYLKKLYPNIYLLVGGPHITLAPEKVIKDSFDALCIGEGEYPTLELVQQLERGQKPSGIKNLWIKKDEAEIEKNSTRNFIQNLDDLPFPDRDMWQKWILYRKSRHSVLVSRGCPFLCTYCSNHALRKAAEGKYNRFRAPDEVIKELKEVITKYPHSNEVLFESETIGTDNKFVMELCSKLEEFNREYGQLTYGADFRIMPQWDYSELFKSLKKANFRFLNIGLESGSQKVRQKMLNRNYTNEDIRNVVKLAREHGLSICFYVMVGIPGETFDDFKETIRLCREIQPEGIYLAIYFPYDGTELYNYCKEHNLLPDKLDPVLDRKKAILDLPGFSKKEIQRQNDWFYYNVYKGHRPLYTTLGYVLFRKLSSNYFTFMLYGRLRKFKLFEKLSNKVKLFSEK